MASKKNRLQFPVLLGDIGGTNARFRLLLGRDDDQISLGEVKTADFASIESAIKFCLSTNSSLPPKSSILAAAGPISSRGLNLTNCPWVIESKRLLQSCKLTELILLNDFEAQALAVTVLDNSRLLKIGSGEVDGEANKVILGPGTGLGVSGLVYAQSKWFPVSGEGGHVDIGPQSDSDRKFWPYIKTVGGRVSAETLISGSGLVNIYSAIAKSRDLPVIFEHPAEITEKMKMGGDSIVRETIEVFCRVLGRVAGDLALTFMARGGVYLAGGISKRIAAEMNNGEFRKSFENKDPHRELMSSIPTFVVMDEFSALEGMAALARAPEIFGLNMTHRYWSHNPIDRI